MEAQRYFPVQILITNGLTMAITLSDSAREILKAGQFRTKVKRSGMLQFITFHVKAVELGKERFTELFSERIIELPEVERVANLVGLPVEVQNGRVFPKGTSAMDFVNVSL